MTMRLREAQALADGREWRQRVVELETQVGQAHTGTPRWTPRPYMTTLLLLLHPLILVSRTTSTATC